MTTIKIGEHVFEIEKPEDWEKVIKDGFTLADLGGLNGKDRYLQAKMACAEQKEKDK